jgi:hypothetical protein
MRLTDDQQRRAIAHFGRRIGSPKCPMCSAASLRLQRELAPLTPPSSDDDAPSDDAPSDDAPDDGAPNDAAPGASSAVDGQRAAHWAVQLVCPHCGYVMHFSADTMGLFGEGDGGPSGAS